MMDNYVFVSFIYINIYITCVQLYIVFIILYVLTIFNQVPQLLSSHLKVVSVSAKRNIGLYMQHVSFLTMLYLRRNKQQLMCLVMEQA